MLCGCKREHVVFCLEKLKGVHRPVGKAGRKEAFQDKQQEIQRHTVYFVYPKYMVGAPRS